VLVFQRHWNEHVSPGEAIFALRGEGADQLEQAKATQGEVVPIHEKEIFR